MTNATTTKPAPVTQHDTATYTIGSSSAAWNFMRACQAAGLLAGYPSVDGRHTVKVSIRTWMDREAADKLAGALPTAYEFAGAPLYG